MQGSGGGPSENNVSGYLVRSTSTAWKKNSVLAVDAGTHLSGIISIFQHQLLNAHAPALCPFAGAPLPSSVPKANASFVVSELVSTYLLTHAHLDHLSGFAINTASFTPKNVKRLAALPKVITAVKTHIFNDVIWPNLSEEDSGVGLFRYERLPESSDYVSVSEGLSAQAWPVSHGHCMKLHTHWGRKSTISLDAAHGHDIGSQSLGSQNLGTPHASHPKWCVIDSAVFFIRDDATGKEVMMWGDVEPGLNSITLPP